MKIRSAQEMKPYLFELKGYFTQYKLFNVIRLYSTYSIRIYELLKQFEKIGIRKISVYELRQMLDIKEGVLSKYNDFKRNVLQIAQKELIQKTDIKFEFKEIKTGKKITDLEFNISRNNDYDGQITLAELDIGQAEEQVLEMEHILKNLQEQFKAKTNTDIKPDVLSTLIEAKGVDLVKRYIDHWDKFNYQDIKNVVGFFMQAVLNEYDMPKASKKYSLRLKDFEGRKYENLNDLYDNFAQNNDLAQ